MAKSYKDLRVYQSAYALSLAVHRTSLDFPKIEQYAGIADQLRRSSKAICANLVEGYAKQTKSRAEFVRYIWIAIGSADESKLWIQYACDLGYLEKKLHAEWEKQYSGIIAALHKLAQKS